MRWRSVGLVCIAVVGLLISLDLAAFQVGIAGPPWEPLFGDGSRRVLTSDLSRLLPVPDAAAGAGAYVVEALLGAAVGAVLVGYQLLVVGAACTLCIASAAVSWVLAGGALIEARERHRGRSSSDDDGGAGAGPRSHGPSGHSKESVAT